MRKKPADTVIEVLPDLFVPVEKTEERHFQVTYYTLGSEVEKYIGKRETWRFRREDLVDFLSFFCDPNEDEDADPTITFLTETGGVKEVGDTLREEEVKESVVRMLRHNDPTDMAYMSPAEYLEFMHRVYDMVRLVWNVESEEVWDYIYLLWVERGIGQKLLRYNPLACRKVLSRLEYYTSFDMHSYMEIKSKRKVTPRQKKRSLVDQVRKRPEAIAYELLSGKEW